MPPRDDDVSIRPALPDDAPTLAAAARELTQTPGLFASTPAEIQDDAFAGHIQRLNALTNGCYVVATRANQLVGHALLDPMTLVSVAHVVHLTIAVHSGFERRGIGRLLLSHLIDWARAEPSVEKIELRVRSTNLPAFNLYRSLGFVEEGRLLRRIKLPDGRYIDDIAMALWVGEPGPMP